MAIHTLCIRPDDYEDVRLFVPRQEYDEVHELLTSLLNSKGTKRRRLLVHGERGIGKSIAVRAAVTDLEQRRQDFFPVIVPGDRCTTVTHLITEIAEILAEQVRRHFPKDKDLLRATAYLTEIVKIDKITRGKFHKLGAEIEGRVEQDWGLLDFFRLKLGIRGAISEETGEEEAAEIIIDDTFRVQVLGRVLTRIGRDTGKEPLVFVDNLDQVGELSEEEGARKIFAFIRLLLNLDQVPVVVTIRSEHVSADISREHRTPVSFGPLPPNQLLQILDRRLGVECPDAEALRERGLPSMAEKLTEATGNPHAFLTWIEYLCWRTPLRRTTFLEDLKGYIPAYHTTVAEEALEAARWFLARDNKRASRDVLMEELELDEDEIHFLERHGIIVPDDVTRPAGTRRYHLSPRLTFLKLVS